MARNGGSGDRSDFLEALVVQLLASRDPPNVPDAMAAFFEALKARAAAVAAAAEQRQSGLKSSPPPPTTHAVNHDELNRELGSFSQTF